MDVDRLQVWPDPALGFTGALEMRVEYLNVRFQATVTRTGKVFSASRQVIASSPGAFYGTWKGGVVARACVSGNCNNIGEPSEVTLQLTQAGDVVTGIGFGFPVSGTVSGDTLSLTGEKIVLECNYDWEGTPPCTQRLLSFAATVDEFGRMHGTFTRFTEFWKDKYYNYTYTGELVSVIRQPVLQFRAR